MPGSDTAGPKLPRMPSSPTEMPQAWNSAITTVR